MSFSNASFASSPESKLTIVKHSLSFSGSVRYGHIDLPHSAAAAVVYCTINALIVVHGIPGKVFVFRGLLTFSRAPTEKCQPVLVPNEPRTCRNIHAHVGIFLNGTDQAACSRQQHQNVAVNTPVTTAEGTSRTRCNRSSRPRTEGGTIPQLLRHCRRQNRRRRLPSRTQSRSGETERYAPKSKVRFGPPASLPRVPPALQSEPRHSQNHPEVRATQNTITIAVSLFQATIPSIPSRE